jgi:zinc and cadmium transporter
LIADDAPGASFGTKAVKLHWGAAAFGLTLHTLLGGVALASAVAADRSTLGDLGASTWGVFLATLIHKPADALTITSLMLRAGMKKNHAHWANFGFSLMVPIGVALFFAGAEISSDPLDTRAWTAVTLAFSAGSFLCIALSDLLPELHFHEHDRLKLSAALLAGVGIMWVAEIFHTGQ